MSNHNLRRVFGLLGIGWFVAICVGGLTLLGNYLDNQISSPPIFTMTGLILGLIIAGYGIYVGLKSLISENKEYLPKRPGEPDCIWADISLIMKELPWKPQVSFEDGVKNMIADINSWSDAPLWDKKSIEEATKSWFKYLS